MIWKRVFLAFHRSLAAVRSENLSLQPIHDFRFSHNLRISKSFRSPVRRPQLIISKCSLTSTIVLGDFSDESISHVDICYISNISSYPVLILYEWSSNLLIWRVFTALYSCLAPKCKKPLYGPNFKNLQNLWSKACPTAPVPPFIERLCYFTYFSCENITYEKRCIPFSMWYSFIFSYQLIINFSCRAVLFCSFPFSRINCFLHFCSPSLGTFSWSPHNRRIKMLKGAVL